jgi:thioredoxin 1
VLTPLLKGATGPETNFDLMTVNVDEFPELASEHKVGNGSGGGNAEGR